jgi:hypothetical protein
MEALTSSVKTDAAAAAQAAAFLRNVARYSQMHRALAAWDYDLLEHAWLWELAWACSTAARRSTADTSSPALPRWEEVKHAVSAAIGERAEQWRRERARLERRFPAQILAVAGDLEHHTNDLTVVQTLVDGIDRLRARPGSPRPCNRDLAAVEAIGLIVEGGATRRVIQRLLARLTTGPNAELAETGDRQHLDRQLSDWLRRSRIGLRRSRLHVR